VTPRAVDLANPHVTAGAPTAIAIEGVAHDFGEEGEAQFVRALDEVSLSVAKGEFIALLGPSGCGKSTLLNIVGGLLSATRGEVRVGGVAVKGPLPRDIAFVFQESTLFPWNTILENFHIGLKFQGVARVEWDERAQRALQSVGMQAFAGHYPGQLSVGMKQRIQVARAICLETEILLMDEPFAALDEQTRMVLGEDLSVLLARTGKTIVFVTHSLAEATFLADRIVVMTARPARIKRILEVGEPHPRDRRFMTSDKFNRLRNDLYELLHDEIRQTVEMMREVTRAE
jgi:NitT/TauT family transport system ATP-binding protein